MMHMPFSKSSPDKDAQNSGNFGEDIRENKSDPEVASVANSQELVKEPSMEKSKSESRRDRKSSSERKAKTEVKPDSNIVSKAKLEERNKTTVTKYVPIYVTGDGKPGEGILKDSLKGIEEYFSSRNVGLRASDQKQGYRRLTTVTEEVYF